MATHLHDELKTSVRIQVETKYGKVTGGRAANKCAVFLEVPYALPPARFEDPQPLPADFRYDIDKEFTREASYAFQPTNDGQAQNTPFEDKVGLGNPTENALFLNIVSPPSFPCAQKFPVRVYIHGGFLQFGSPHGLKSQAQYISAERSEVWVNIGYRLSAFGFLASSQPEISGNFGFKDQWLALVWIKENIDSFGGDPENIQVIGLSAGAHSVHQLLHFASHLPKGTIAPFTSAVLQSNAIVNDPRTPQELRPQFEALCGALNIDPSSSDALDQLVRVPASEITRVIETDALGTKFGTFRGCLDGKWIPASPGPMEWQRSGGFASALREKGDIAPNLERYYPQDMVTAMTCHYPSLPDTATSDESIKLFGEIFSDFRVHLPIRILARDLHEAGFPVLRYEIRWVPEQLRTGGYITHGTDRALWTFRVPDLNEEQIEVARVWLARIAEETQALENGGKTIKGSRDILVLGEDRTVEWKVDLQWDDKMKLMDALA
ncbi:carboxylic ester hydrolase [Favolaschia claudopus]|uniref:Carboxylic ester hydrolase n=1 Tax=Favolaschia claudopus TaxID=2862362 RepID=A0AAW0BYU1_9AGAR